MNRFFILFLHFLLIAFSSKAITLDSIVIHMQMDNVSNILHVTESYYPPNDEVLPNWHRVIFHKYIDNYPLLYQRLKNVNLKDNNGKEYQLTEYGYGRERTHLDYIKNGLKGASHLHYDILHPFNKSTDFIYDFRFYDFPFTAKSIVLYFELKDACNLIKNNWSYSYYNQYAKGDFGYNDDLTMSKIGPQLYSIRFNPVEDHLSLYEPGLEGQFKFDKPITLSAPSTYFTEWNQQGGALIWVTIIAIILALFLRFLPIYLFPNAIRIYGLVLFIIMLVAGLPMIDFFWKATGWSDNFLLELISHLIFWFFFGIIGYTVHKDLSKQNSKSYYAVLAFPFLTTVLLFPASVNPVLYLSIPISFAPFLFWFQSKNATFLGASYYEIVEQVETAGKISFINLGNKNGLSIDRLITIINRIPNHPILIDYEEKEFLSASAANLRNKYNICTNCGATTNIQNEDLLSCNHCHTEYRESQQKASSKPIPSLVKLTAQILQNLASIIHLLIVFLAFAILIEFMFDGFGDFGESMLTLLVFGFIFYKTGTFLSKKADQLLDGTMDSGVWILLPFCFFITPVFLLYQFKNSNRIQLFFDKNAIPDIEKFIKEKGSCSVKDLARHLMISQEDALEIADYLCGNNLIEAVHDIQNSHIVHRDQWAKLSGTNSCKSCGGFVQIKETSTECMYCGIIG